MRGISCFLRCLLCVMRSSRPLSPYPYRTLHIPLMKPGPCHAEALQSKTSLVQGTNPFNILETTLYRTLAEPHQTNLNGMYNVHIRGGFTVLEYNLKSRSNNLMRLVQGSHLVVQVKPAAPAWLQRSYGLFWGFEGLRLSGVLGV